MERHGGACMVLTEHDIQSTPSLTVMHEECAKDWQQHMKNTHTFVSCYDIVTNPIRRHQAVLRALERLGTDEAA